MGIRVRPSAICIAKTENCFHFFGCLEFYSTFVMAGSGRLALRRIFSGNTSTVLRRNLSSNSAFRAALVDVTNPAQSERTSASLSDALAAKEKGPWTELNKEDKIALYRSSFPLTMAEAEKTEPELGRLMFGVTIGVSVAVAFFVFLKKYVGPQAPRTLTQEWRDAQAEKMRRQNMNPITGISSQK